jgi:putative transposase
MIKSDAGLSIVDQCQLLDLPRSTFYYREKPENPEDLRLMLEIDKIHLATPFYGSRKIHVLLVRRGFRIGRGKVRRLMRRMGLEAIYRKPRTSLPKPGNHVYPFLLNSIEIERTNQAWAADITYLPMAQGFAYLMAIIDLHSRKVMAWRLSNTLDTGFCLDALEEAIHRFGPPEIFNTDQGCQFTSDVFTSALKAHNVQISMDGKGRWIDNVFIERLWRSIKYEEVYLKAYKNLPEAKQSLGNYLELYNQSRIHQHLDYQTPDEVYFGKPVQNLAA